MTHFLCRWRAEAITLISELLWESLFWEWKNLGLSGRMSIILAQNCRRHFFDALGFSSRENLRNRGASLCIMAMKLCRANLQDSGERVKHMGWERSTTRKIVEVNVFQVILEHYTSQLSPLPVMGRVILAVGLLQGQPHRDEWSWVLTHIQDCKHGDTVVLVLVNSRHWGSKRCCWKLTFSTWYTGGLQVEERRRFRVRAWIFSA